MADKQRYVGPLYVLAAAVLWSTAGAFTKFIPWAPLTVAGLRGTIAAITIAVCRRKVRVTLTPSVTKAALCMAVTTILFMCANKTTTAANAVVLQYTMPIYVILFNAMIHKVRPKGLDITAILLMIAGIVLCFVGEMGTGALLGNAMALISGITFAGAFLFNSLPDSNTADAAFIGYGLSVLLLPTLFFDKSLGTGGATAWLALLYLGIFQLGLPYLLFAKGLKSTGPVAASILCGIEPILSPIWTFLLVGEIPTTLAIAGAVLVIGTIGVYNVITAKVAAASSPPAEAAVSSSPAREDEADTPGSG